MAAVLPAGTQIAMSHSAFSRPPLPPVRPMVARPSARPTCTARMTLGALPEVLIAIRASPGRP